MPPVTDETLRALERLEVTSGHPRVALRLIELARDPGAPLRDFLRWVELDPSLTARVLGVVHSAWHGRRVRAGSTWPALVALGGRQVRTLVLGHGVASLHQAMALRAGDSRLLWGASICKGLLAQRVAGDLAPEVAAEAYTAGLLQDLGLALLLSVDREAVLRIHRGAGRPHAESLELEREHFGLDHAEAGLRLARRLGLPRELREAIATHHDHAPPISAAEIARAAASHLPHDGRSWSLAELERLRTLVEGAHGEGGAPTSSAPGLDAPPGRTEALVQAAQEEYDAIRGELGDAAEPASLLEALIFASQENARAAGATVAQNLGLREDRSHLHRRLTAVERAHLEARQRADLDPLTRLFNRAGWDRRARARLRRRGEEGAPLAVAFFDLDRFKELNDDRGHATGDGFLREVGARLARSVRGEDLVCRWGGDEFLVLFAAESVEACLEAARRVQHELQAAPVSVSGAEVPVSVTVGVVLLEVPRPGLELERLVQLADAELYRAKAARRGSLRAACLEDRSDPGD
jgi:diguanylate cyclase (GGDEF)-like protein